MALPDSTDPQPVATTNHFPAPLQLISWRIDPDGSITRTGDSSAQAGGVSGIALASTGQPSAPFVTAVKRIDGTLSLISWDADPAHGENLTSFCRQPHYPSRGHRKQL